MSPACRPSHTELAGRQQTLQQVQAAWLQICLMATTVENTDNKPYRTVDHLME